MTTTEIKPLSETRTRKLRHNPRDFDILELQIKEARKNCVVHIHYAAGGRAIIEFEEKEEG
jgi:hypothetical protein